MSGGSTQCISKNVGGGGSRNEGHLFEDPHSKDNVLGSIFRSPDLRKLSCVIVATLEVLGSVPNIIPGMDTRPTTFLSDERLLLMLKGEFGGD